MSETFDVQKFISESNLIDPQYSNGEFLPGAKPGDPLYDRHLSALDCAMDLFSSKYLPRDFDRQIHRELTRGIAFFEDCGMSGAHRLVDVRIGGNYAESPRLLRPFIEERLHSMIMCMKGESTPYPAEDAWRVHDCFECIHPFIDGNGRTGRCILNGLRVALGLAPIIIYYDMRFGYYRKIQEFLRDHYQSFREASGVEIPCALRCKISGKND